MSGPDEAGAAKGALAPLIAEMKQKPVGTAFEKPSDWLLKAGAAVTLAGMAIAFVVLKQDEISLWVRGTLILTIFGGCLVLTAGVALQALGSFLSLRRYNEVLCKNLEGRFDQATDLAKGLAASMPVADISRMLRHIRLEIRIAERMTFKVTTGSALVAGFASLVGVLAFEPVSRSIAETITLMAPGAALGAIIAGALMHSFTDRLIRAEHVLAEAELMSGVRPKPRARFVHRRLQTRPG